MLTTTRNNGKMIRGTDNPTYSDLLIEFLPRPISSEEGYKITQREIDRLLDKEELSSDEQDYLDLLGTLIMDYESRVEDEVQYELQGIALVRGLMELHNLKQKDLVSIFKTRSIASAVLNGKRPLTVEHIDKLAAYFHLPHQLFFEPR
jgi:HTH-type transcriptional regulator/antitoxin HigA